MSAAVEGDASARRARRALTWSRRKLASVWLREPVDEVELTRARVDEDLAGRRAPARRLLAVHGVEHRASRLWMPMLTCPMPCRSARRRAPARWSRARSRRCGRRCRRVARAKTRRAAVEEAGCNAVGVPPPTKSCDERRARDDPLELGDERADVALHALRAPTLPRSSRTCSGSGNMDVP